jgi:hypothetical protein
MASKIIFAAVHAKLTHKNAINSFDWCMTRLSAVRAFSANPLAAAPIFLIPASVKDVLYFGLYIQLK